MRYMRVRISIYFLIDLITEGKEYHVRCIKGLPDGAKFCYSITTHNYIWVDFVFEHPSFEIVMLGNEIPLFPDPQLEKL